MAPRRRSSPTICDPAQPTLPGVPSPLATPVPAPPTGLPGSLSCAAAVCGLVSYAIDEARGAGLSRAMVAARMSELTGERITEAMLNACTAESHEGHRFPAQWLPALIVATNSYALMRDLADRVGAVVLVGQEAVSARLGQLDAQMDSIRRQKALLKRMHGGRS
ncbi:hypothetical protein [Azospirillum aestuarii]|uniref:hypothetical protein n=1 Tax=Azospirillum aestuarii TaxID=2802052 RepID=UPI004054BE52